MASRPRSPRQNVSDVTYSPYDGEQTSSTKAESKTSPRTYINETCLDLPKDDISDSDIDDEDDRRILRALTADDNISDSSSSEDVAADEKAAETAGSPAQSETPSSGSLVPPTPSGKSLSASSASVLGKITSGLSAAFAGPSAMKRSPRVGVAPEPSPRPASSASTTRTPSPENFIWRPIKPGYIVTDGGLQSRTIVQQTVQVEQTETESRSRDEGLKQSIVVMPLPLAVACCFLNFISPGLGTFISGLSLMCCSRPQTKGADRSNLVLLNTWLALLQVITVIFFLAGWIWSVAWGITFIKISNNLYSSNDSNAPIKINNSVNQSNENRLAGTTTTATRTTTTTTTTTTCSSSDTTENQATAPEPPIIVLQEAPVIVQPNPFAFGAPGWSTRAGVLPPVARNYSDLRRTSQSATSSDRRTSVTSRQPSGAQPYTRRQRITQRRQTASQRAAEHLTGVLLCPETLEHIVIHSSVVPDPQFASSSSGGSTSVDVTHKPN